MRIVAKKTGTNQAGRSRAGRSIAVIDVASIGHDRILGSSFDNIEVKVGKVQEGSGAGANGKKNHFALTKRVSNYFIGSWDRTLV
jgi:hypothetical protein